MLDFLHHAIDWMGSLILFIVLALVYLAALVLIIDEVIDIIVKDRIDPIKEEDDEPLF